LGGRRSIAIFLADPRWSGLWCDQGEPAFRVVSLTQVDGTVRQHDLKRRPNVTLQQMARNRASAATTQHTMDVQRRLLIWPKCDIARKRCDFHLLVDRDALIALGLPVEIAENRRTEGTDGAELRRVDLLLSARLRRLRQLRRHLRGIELNHAPLVLLTGMDVHNAGAAFLKSQCWWVGSVQSA
jgi:hypothetical protein